MPSESVIALDVQAAFVFHDDTNCTVSWDTSPSDVVTSSSVSPLKFPHRPMILNKIQQNLGLLHGAENYRIIDSKAKYDILHLDYTRSLMK